MAKFE